VAWMREARAMPMPTPRPWPSEPVAHSTPGTAGEGLLGEAGAFLVVTREVFLGKKPRFARTV